MINYLSFILFILFMMGKILNSILRRGGKAKDMKESETWEKPYRLDPSYDARFMNLSEIDAAEFIKTSSKLWEQSPADYIPGLIKRHLGMGGKIVIQSSMNEIVGNAIEPYVEKLGLGCEIVEIDPECIEFVSEGCYVDDSSVDIILSWGLMRSFQETSFRLKAYSRILRSGGYVMGLVPPFEVPLLEEVKRKTKVGTLDNSHLSEMLEYNGLEEQLISARGYEIKKLKEGKEVVEKKNGYFFIARKK